MLSFFVRKKGVEARTIPLFTDYEAVSKKYKIDVFQKKDTPIIDTNPA